MIRSRSILIALKHERQQLSRRSLLSTVVTKKELDVKPVQKQEGDEKKARVDVLKVPVDQEKIQRILNDLLSLNMVEKKQFQLLLSQELGFPNASAVIMSKLRDVDLNNLGSSIPQQQQNAALPTQAAPAAAAAPPAKPVQTSFELKLESFAAGDKIKVIKLVREITGLGLKEAKDKVEAVPCVLLKDLEKDPGEAWVEKLKAAGAKSSLV